jgi:hypothetical protein
MTTVKSSRFWIALSLSAYLLLGILPVPASAKADPGKGATALVRSSGAKKGKQKPAKAAKPSQGRTKKGVHPPQRRK